MVYEGKPNFLDDLGVPLFLETPIWDRLSFQRKLPCKDMHEGHQVRSANPEETDPAMYPPNKP